MIGFIENKNTYYPVIYRVACLECGVLFSKNSISKHIKRIHRLVKDFQCDLCGTSCFLKRDIIDHMKVRSGENSSANNNIKIDLFSDKTHITPGKDKLSVL